MANEQHALRCSCGTVHSVIMGMCGLDLLCECGETVQIPSSLRLRELAGLPAVEPEPEPELVIPEIVKSGELPLASCLVCGLDADAVHYWIVECQRQHAHFDSRTPSLGWVLFGPVLWLVTGPFAILRPERSFEAATEVYGRDVYVRAPFRVCDHCLAMVRTSWTDSLLKTMCWLILVAGLFVMFVNPLLGLTVMGSSTIPQVVMILRDKRLQERRMGCLQKIPVFDELFEKYPDTVIMDER